MKTIFLILLISTICEASSLSHRNLDEILDEAEIVVIGKLRVSEEKLSRFKEEELGTYLLGPVPELGYVYDIDIVLKGSKDNIPDFIYAESWYSPWTDSKNSKFIIILEKSFLPVPEGHESDPEFLIVGPWHIRSLNELQKVRELLARNKTSNKCE